MATTRKRKVENEQGVTTSASAMDAARATTLEERRRVLLETLRVAGEIADDDYAPSSARARALTEARQIVVALGDLDREERPAADSWASVTPKAV